MKSKLLLTLSLFLVLFEGLLATGAPSTYFNIYVPPNNDAVRRDVALIVTAVSDHTTFTITDDATDGDADDSVSGVLMAGQSYVLYIRDNGINDDAQYASGGTLTWDGDYFTIESDKLVYASMSTNSDWQHDFVSSVNKKTTGSKFLIYSPTTSFSDRDLNVFAYEDDTRVTISRISRSATTTTGYTDVDMRAAVVVAQVTLDVGEDIIHTFANGRDLMKPGETFLIETNKNISVQYGALWNNARDGGGYVPDSTGSSVGELFYFAVPYQADGEQEIRIVSWDDNNPVTLDRYENGSWIPMGAWNLDQFQPAEFVGRAENNSTYPTVFRVRSSEGKNVSVFEANWMETGSVGTSDMATMMSSSSGPSSGTEFLAYIAPPGYENNVTDPFTGSKINAALSHLYLFASKADATVTITDAKTGGEVFNKTYVVPAGYYADAQITVEEWRSIYNGTGTSDGPDRPYLFISSDRNISVLNTNFNDNWMTYFGSSLPHGFELTSTGGDVQAVPGEVKVLTSALTLAGDNTLENTVVSVDVGSGAVPLSSSLINLADGSVIEGEITVAEDGSHIIFYDVPKITTTDQYEVQTEIMLSATYNDGDVLADGTVVSVQTSVSGDVDGYREESIVTQGIQNDAADGSLMMFNECGLTTFQDEITDSWNAVWFDYDNDGWDDLFVTTKDKASTNLLYHNDAGTLVPVTSGQPVIEEAARSAAAVAADINNDGYPELFVVNATGTSSSLYLNNGGTFELIKDSGISIHPEYFHGASFADFDNDGFVDLLVTNFFESRFHHLYRNNGDNTFTLESDNAIATTSARSTAPILADYDNDGLVDVFIPNGGNEPNSLFRNLGNFQFESVDAGAITTDAYNSVGAAWGDYDNDGDVDLFVANASGQDNNFYVNNGDGTFTANTDTRLTTDGGHSHGTTWVDVNRDGWLDLLVNNDDGRNFLYLNDGAGDFELQYGELIGSDFGSAYGMAWSDYDRDGDLDAFISTHDYSANRLFCGSTSDNHWIGVELTGTISNQDAIGARIAVKSGDQWYYHSVLPVSGFGSQSSLTQYFGLGDMTTVDSVRVEWPSGIVQDITSGLQVDAVNHFVEPTGAAVTFQVFADMNGNGTQDEGEPSLSNQQLNLSGTDQLVVSGSDGHAITHVSVGSHTVEYADNPTWRLDTDVSFEITSLSDAVTVPVPLTPVQTGYDVSIDVIQSPWRRGFTSYTIVTVQNDGVETVYPADVTLTYPDDVFVVESGQEYTIIGNQYVWTIDSLAPGESFAFSVMDSVGLNTFTGEMLSFSAEVYLTAGDTDPANNVLLRDVEVVGAFDPNDIAVLPKGEGNEGWVDADGWLTYRIRFQNVGTYYAANVRIENPLSEYLDPATLEVVGASHNVSVSFSNGVLMAYFDDIMLADSSTNEAASHGTFKYRIKPKQNALGGERILNRAAIYFDFEKPVLTNTVLNTLKYDRAQTAERLNVFPNPASGYCKINTNMDFVQYREGSQLRGYTIRTMLGRVVTQVDLPGLDEATVDLTFVPHGVYLIEATDQFERRYLGRLIVR
ncbi:CRTAC1 family protein [Lewinella sp. IMCC34191]|uniref:CRTAC1 family protein n=1 Tax=Lewinella sp. IMCC34191 TaxID=2259172 RepID=UPI000E23D3C2|nr:CRTAC1 family protein [Lewinella sp. IMCC34191]